MNPEQLLEALDPEQRDAAMSLVGPTCILAGAGTGKTRTVTHRIAYGIAKGHFAANRILALTYTSRAAGELRARLRQLGIPGVAVKTFHAAALSQLEFFWPQLAGVPAPNVLNSKGKFIAEAAEKLGIRFDAAMLRDVAAEIEWRKYTMRSIEQYASQVSLRPAIAGLKPEQIVALHQAYEEIKIKSQKLDWEDVLLLTLGMLQAEPRILAHVQQQYRFFTVDEYQDISPLQQALLEAWLGDRSDLCVVGDPNQTIYSFSGASSSHLLQFASTYPDATIISLTRNYRSTGNIISMANRVIRGETSMDELESQGVVGSTPAFFEAKDSAAEAAQIAAEIKSQLSRGIKPNEIAVLYRVNSQSELFEKALAEHGIEYQVRGGERFFNRPEILQVIRLVRAETIVPTEKPLYQLVTDAARELGWKAKEPAEGGAVRDQWEALNSFIAIVDELPEGSSIHDFVKEIDERIRSQHEPVKAAVTLSTIHAAKGLEWDSVFLAGLNEGLLPISYAKTDLAIYEERRLFYVGITRARKELSLSFAKINAVNGREQSRSRFLELVLNA
jgi:DNA helicase-2/ATP-dependent DNA helicase PcrA